MEISEYFTSIIIFKNDTGEITHKIKEMKTKDAIKIVKLINTNSITHNAIAAINGMEKFDNIKMNIVSPCSELEIIFDNVAKADDTARAITEVTKDVMVYINGEEVKNERRK